MKEDLKRSIETFVSLLPYDNLPPTPINSHDSYRFIWITYYSELDNIAINFDYLKELLLAKYNNLDESEIDKYIETCKQISDDWRFVIGCLIHENILKNEHH